MKKLLFIASVLLGITITSCKKETGCTDSSATNFKTNAEKDDGSCTYKGSYVFWTQSLSAPYSVNVYINDIFQGNVSVNFASAPACDATGALTINKNLGASKTLGYTLNLKMVNAGVVDTDPANWRTETINFKANTCSSYEIW